MKAALCATFLFTVVTTVLMDRAPSLSAQAPPRACLHGADETPAEQARRRGALTLVRMVNTAQAGFFSSNNRFAAQAELSGLPAVPGGFALQLTADARGYMLSVKDTTDPCMFAVFSDQRGIIYVGGPIQ